MFFTLLHQTLSDMKPSHSQEQPYNISLEVSAIGMKPDAQANSEASDILIKTQMSIPPVSGTSDAANVLC